MTHSQTTHDWVGFFGFITIPVDSSGLLSAHLKQNPLNALADPMSVLWDHSWSTHDPLMNHSWTGALLLWSGGLKMDPSLLLPFPPSRFFHRWFFATAHLLSNSIKNSFSPSQAPSTHDFLFQVHFFDHHPPLMITHEFYSTDFFYSWTYSWILPGPLMITHETPGHYFWGAAIA